MLTLFESECKSGAAKRQFTFEISVLKYIVDVCVDSCTFVVKVRRENSEHS